MIHTDTLKLIADPDILAEIKAHAMAEYPNEACGAITPEGYERLRNVHPDPKRFFDCNEQLLPLQLTQRLVAVVHSHPDGPEGPSAFDQAQQRAFAVPWGLCMCTAEVCSKPYFWGDELEPPPIEGRLFRHGPSGTDGKGDCGALVRDWFRINRGIVIKDYPRDDKWWTHGKHLYLENYTDAGFVKADPQFPEVGDLALLQVGIKVPTANHAAIYIGNGLIVHHLERRLSRKEPFVPWNRYLRAWLRYGGA